MTTEAYPAGCMRPHRAAEAMSRPSCPLPFHQCLWTPGVPFNTHLVSQVQFRQ